MSTYSDLKLLSIDEVVSDTGLSRSTIYRLIGDGTFPKPKKISVRRVAWKKGDVANWRSRLES